jgi:hypothetical protein
VNLKLVRVLVKKKADIIAISTKVTCSRHDLAKARTLIFENLIIKSAKIS